MDALDSQIDALYQLPPAKFTGARTALAKTLAGEAARQVKQLKKPTLVPWAVNQLYWKARPVYERVLKAGHALRTAQMATLKGRRSDVRDAAETHRHAVADAVKQARQLASAAGLAPEPEPMARMFEALSLSVEPPGTPGRLTAVLRPAGFEALAGVTPIGAARRPADSGDRRAEPDEGSAGHDKNAGAARLAEAERKRARQHEQQERLRRREAERSIKAAQRALQLAREAESAAGRALDRAQQDVRAAEKALADARARLP